MNISKRKLSKMLSEHEELKAKRHPMFERNRFVKFLAYFMFAYYAAILLFMGVMLPMPMSHTYHGVAAFHVLDGWFFIIIMIDFWLRFILQDTPANQARPYSLLPISRKFLMRRYLVNAGLSWGNLYWAFFLVPFAFLSVFRSMSLAATAGWLIGWWLLIVLNSYFYLLIRSLCTRNISWAVLPFIMHAAIVCIATIPDHNVLDMPCTNFMYGFAKLQPLCFIGVIAVILLLFKLNEKVQGIILYDEIGKKEETEVKNVSKMSWFNRFGIVGEYLKLEVKIRMRCRTLKMQFFVLIGCMLLLSGILYFTDIYDGLFMKSFICLYDYIVPGMSTLVTIMCYEGNYMDLLMSRKESIRDMLTAKYYFNSALLLIPFCLLIPLMAIGKITIWMNLGYLFFTVGVLYPMMFQMSAYNKETLPLDAKLTGKQGNGAQNMVSFAVMFVPIAIERASVTLLGDPWGYILLISLGMIGIVTHQRWLSFTYKRFMERRYTNMEGFRATRK